MKFSKGDVVQRALPSGLMVGGLMIVIARARGKCTAVRDVSTGKCYIYNSSSLGMVGKTTVDEIRKGYEMVPVKQPMYKLQLICEL